jgi:hypothetical protein
LDDNSADDSADGVPCAAYKLPPEPWKLPWGKTRIALANAFAGGLLRCYDVVLFTDVDEFLVPDPALYDGLLHYLSVNDRDVVAPLAVNVLHSPTTEPVLDPAQPVLVQRQFVKFADNMCKPLIKRIAADWSAGFHAVDVPFEIDRSLLMLHLKYYDLDALQKVSSGRHALHQEGRGHAKSAWGLNADEVTSKLFSWVETSDEQGVPEFDVREPDLTRIIRSEKNGSFRARGGQLAAMERNPLRRIPERFRTAL